MKPARSFALLTAVSVVLTAVAGAASPAEQRIALAQRAIAGGEVTADTYNALAFAFARRARETADPQFYAKATEAVGESLRLAPDNLEAAKARVWILLGQHEFSAALREAMVLNQRNPDDLMVYAMLVDAHVELGNLREAETAAQWLLDLRPGNVVGLGRAAYLRELFGDLEGALELMGKAYARTPPTETEDRAWLLTHIAHLQRIGGELGYAETALAEALRQFPDYHYSLAELARVRIAQKRYGEAVDLLQKRFTAAPHPENQYDLAVALKLDGRRRAAAAAFKEFEKKASAESSGADNANRELVLYYTDHARRPREALRLAEQEMARRPNLLIRDAYAWALFANGRAAEARQQLQEVLSVGTRDPEILAHARRLGLKPPSGTLLFSAAQGGGETAR